MLDVLMRMAHEPGWQVDKPELTEKIYDDDVGMKMKHAKMVDCRMRASCVRSTST